MATLRKASRKRIYKLYSLEVSLLVLIFKALDKLLKASKDLYLDYTSPPSNLIRLYSYRSVGKNRL